MLDDRTIRYIAAVARCASIRAASRELDVAPSAVQRGIAAAERQIGLELFERDVRGAVATEAGRLVAAHAQDRRDLGDQLDARVDELKGVVRGHVSLGTGEGFVSRLWDQALEPFLTAHPGVSIALHTEGTDQLLDMVAADRVDIAIALHPRPDSRIAVVGSRPEPLRLVCRPDHPFAVRDIVRPGDLEGTEFALMPPRFGVRGLTDLLMSTHGVTVVPRLETDSQQAIIRSVRAGRTLALLPEVTVEAELTAQTLVAVPVDDPQADLVQSRLLLRQGRHLLPAARAVVATCAEHLFSTPASA